MPKLTRRGFLSITGAAIALRGAAPFARGDTGRQGVTMVYDKSLGMMRIVERFIP